MKDLEFFHRDEAVSVTQHRLPHWQQGPVLLHRCSMFRFLSLLALGLLWLAKAPEVQARAVLETPYQLGLTVDEGFADGPNLYAYVRLPEQSSGGAPEA